ncbi:hypothetical protein K503DRAFT_802799 [Rhizopogon vinicolor AM-OR11-026]|uniref:FAD-binding domain-containing protein n=1 Tax=Rhizopogon vinicolor AM-OR11-026 TaxID=1314800 RepID=A0A1B7MS83_9AGAM|nr:hypothetical protein K503DRAFT_802799 [Rhizopogon vinicolor AM-OR11-026]
MNDVDGNFTGTVRKQLGLTFQGETREDFYIVTGDIRLTGPCLDGVHWHRFGTFSGRVISLRPTDEIAEDGWQFFILGPDLDIGKIAQSEELIFETLASMIDTEITFHELVWVTEYRPNLRMVNKFSKGRVFVAGDAAHVHSPTSGQGLNSGVQDAFNLGWKLALVEKRLAHKSLLETYSTERFPVISDMLEVTTSILNNAVKTGSTAGWANTILFMLGIHCHFSSIVLDEFATPTEGKPTSTYMVLDETHLEAGDRAPDAPKLLHVYPRKSDMMTLFSLYRPWYHTVLVFAPSPADATPILARAIRQDLVLVDQEGHAYSAYLVESNQMKIFAIRPDGVIGAVVHGSEDVKKYFSKIFWEV